MRINLCDRARAAELLAIKVFSKSDGYLRIIEFEIIRDCKKVRKCQVSNQLRITARQYGKVVLPDASTGQSPGTLAKKLSRCKEGMARVFAVMVQSILHVGAIAVQF